MNALKVMIVDDEYLIREGLRSFPWSEFGCEVVGEAEDGEEALMLAKVLLPDIILTDIRMPEMDGLQFAAAIKQALPRTEIILLTGFDHFDYAQTAIRTGVYDYLLKPVSLEAMRDTVGRLCENIRASTSRDARYAALQRKYEGSLPLLVGKLAGDLIHGRLYGREDLQRKLALFDLPIERYLVLVARMENLPRLLREQKIEPWLLEFGISNIAEEILERCCQRVLTDCVSSEYRFILLFPAASRGEDCLRAAETACGKIHGAVRQYIGETICFGLSDPGGDAYHIHRHYRQAAEACRQNSLVGETGFLQYRDVQHPTHDILPVTEGEKQLLLEAVAGGDESGVNRFVESLATESSAPARTDALRILLIELLVGCARTSGESGLAARTIVSEGVGILLDCEQEETLLARAGELFSHIARHNNQTHRDYHEMTVGRIIRFLREHHAEDLSLDQIAEQFRLSSSYIGRLLKKHTGQSFLDNLVAIRIEQAAGLLADPAVTVAAVAEAVGYRDQSYFIQVFKKHRGMTPKEYQNFIQMPGSSY